MSPQLIIFDMDGTLYDLNDVLSMTYEMQVCFLSLKLGKTHQETEQLFTENNIFPIVRKESKSATEFFLSQGISKEEWSSYRDSHFDVSKIDVSKAVGNSVVEAFKKDYKIVLLSSNTLESVKRVLSHLHIETDNFKEIICSDNFPYDTPFKKKLVMQYWSEKFKMPFVKMLSIGDRYSTDILPMLELGGEGVLIFSPQYLSKVLGDLKQGTLCTNAAYEYYHQ